MKEGGLKNSFDTVFFGPFLGELGWCLSRWQGFCRFRAESEFKGKEIIVASFPGREPFYLGTATRFIPLPDWFLDKGYDVDSYESVEMSPLEYGRLIQYFLQFYNPATTQEIRTPRGCSFILPSLYQQKINKLIPSENAIKKKNALVGNHPYVVVSARGRSRSSFRNWPEEYWEALCYSILKQYPDLYLVITGAPNGSFLKRFGGDRVVNTIFTPKEESIDLSIAFLTDAVCSITVQSGSTHLSLQSLCPSLIIGWERQRHAVDENYLKTPVMFVETKNYDVHPKFVSDSFNQFYDEIKKRRVQ
jgi:hypothetical protein